LTGDTQRPTPDGKDSSVKNLDFFQVKPGDTHYKLGTHNWLGTHQMGRAALSKTWISFR